MFSLAKKTNSISTDRIPVVVLDYKDLRTVEYFKMPPALTFRQYLQERKMGVLPEFKMIHFPDSGPPCVLDGSLRYQENYKFQVSQAEVWDLDFSSCAPLNESLSSLVETHGFPDKSPVLSNHSESPIVKIQASSVGQFINGETFDGKKMAREWVAALTILHHLSTAATLYALRYPKYKPAKCSFSEQWKDHFMLWWPGAKPVDIYEWLCGLYTATSMDPKDKLYLNTTSPHMAGFYKCVVSKKGIFLDDQSNISYDYEVSEKKAEVLTKVTDRERFTMCIPWLVEIHVDENRKASFRTEHIYTDMFILPCNNVVSSQVGVVRSYTEAHNHEVWKNSVRSEKCDEELLKGFQCEANLNRDSLYSLDKASMPY